MISIIFIELFIYLILLLQIIFTANTHFDTPLCHFKVIQANRIDSPLFKVMEGNLQKRGGIRWTSPSIQAIQSPILHPLPN